MLSNNKIVICILHYETVHTIYVIFNLLIFLNKDKHNLRDTDLAHNLLYLYSTVAGNVGRWFPLERR